MFADSKAYSGFAVPDLEARKLYGETLGCAPPCHWRACCSRCTWREIATR
jgi:hypothetical protein